MTKTVRARLKKGDKKMKIKNLLFISNFNLTKDGKAVILNVSAFDKDAGEWVNGNLFVPIKGFLEFPEREKAYCAVSKNKESGKKECVIKVLNEFVFQGDHATKTESKKKTDKEKDDFIPF